MTDEYIVQTVSEVKVASNNPCWSVAMIRPDGLVHGLVFPKSTLEWRAAEYGIDSTDVDTLLDVILHEQFVPDPNDPLTAKDDAAMRIGMVAQLPGPVLDFGPITLYTAKDTAEAREAHLVRVASAKANRVQVKSPAGKDPLDMIRQSHGMSEERIALMREFVNDHRAEIQKPRAPRNPERSDQLNWRTPKWRTA